MVGSVGNGLASIADVAVVWAATEEGIRGFLVPTASHGFSATPIAPNAASSAVPASAAEPTAIERQRASAACTSSTMIFAYPSTRSSRILLPRRLLLRSLSR